jgi:hypothetical protein
VKKEKLDQLLNKVISRKLMVFAVACGALFFGTLSSSDWVIIATAYIGIQGFSDIVERIKK